MPSSSPHEEAVADPALSESKRFVRNVKWQTVANAGQLILGGLYLVVLGRALEPSGFGVFAIVSAVVAVAGSLFELRLQDVVARDFCTMPGREGGTGGHHTNILDLYILEAASRAAPFLGLVLAAVALPTAMNLPEDGGVLIVLAATGFVFAKVGWGTSTGILRVLGRTDLIALCSTADWGLRLLVTLAVSAAGDLSIAIALVIGLVAGGACNAAQIAFAVREFRSRIAPLGLAGWNVSGAIGRTRPQRRLLASNLGLSASDLMAKDLDVAMISYLLAPEKVGLYKMAKSLVQMSWRAIDPFYLAIMPEVQKLWSEGRYGTLRMLLRKTSLRLLGLSVALVSLACGSVLLLGGAMLGPGYSGLTALMLTMSVWVIVCAPLVWGHPLAVAIGHPELTVGGSLLGSALGFAAFLALTPVIGLHGAAIAWVLTLSVGFIFTAGMAAYIAQRDRFNLL